MIWAAGAACERFRSQLDVFKPTDSQIEAARKALAENPELSQRVVDAILKKRDEEQAALLAS